MSFSDSFSGSSSGRTSLPDAVAEAVRDERRLGALRKQNILDTEPEPAFDRIARLAADILDTESAIVNFIGEDRQWFKSAVGFEEKETSLDDSLCVYTLEKGETMVIEDAAEDDRCKSNPIVTERGVRFYAGVPLRTEEGHQIGTLCVLDTEPRAPTDAELRQLSDLAAIVEDELRLRRETARRREAERQQEMQSTLFESIATGTGTEEVLTQLCHQTEQLVSGARASVLRLEGGRLRHVASPSLPSKYVETMDGLEVGPSAGTCGTAAYNGESVITEDLYSDPRWEGYRSAVEDMEVQSCWAVPIRDEVGDVLGTFALYGPEPRGPSEEEKALLHRMTHVASVALGRDRREQKLRNTEERFRTVVENAQPVVFMLDEEGTFLLSEGEDLEALGLQPGEVVGQSVFDLYAEKTEILEAVQSALDGERVDREMEVDGLYFDSWFSPYYNEEGQVAGVIGMAANITEKRKQERKLQATQKQYRTLVDHFPGAVFLYDEDLRCLLAGGNALEGVGTAAEEIEGESPADRYPPEIAEPLMEALRAALGGEERTLTQNYRDRHYWVQTIPVEEGKACMAVSLDVTEQKEIKQVLRKSEERLRIAIEGGGIGTWNWDVDTGRVEFNRHWAEMLGYSREELDFHFTTWENLVHPEDLPRAMDVLERYVSGDTDTYAPEIRMKTSDGEWTWIQTIGKVIDREADGSVSRVAGVHLDIHDRKQARRDLERYRSYTGRMLDAIDDFFFAIDDQARIRRWNASVPEVTGYSDDEIDEMRAFDFVPDSEEERIAVAIGKGFTSGHAQVEVPLLRKDGTRVPYEFVANLVQHPEEGLRVVGVGRDLTERKKAERQLREERNFLDRILETSPVAIAVLNEDGEFMEASSRAESILGLEKQELKARTYKDPEWRICGPDGGSINDEDLPFAQVMATGEPIYDFEHTIEWPDGTQRLLSVSGAPLHSADGKLEGAVFHMDDITEEREAQRTLERQNDLFTKAQDIADVGAWEYDVRSGETIVTEQVNHILGLEPDAAAGPEETIGFFHPDDQSTLQDAFRRAIREGISYDLELRLTTENEDHRWVRTRGEPQWENGEIARIRGTIQDITERRCQQQQLRERQQKVEVLYEATSQILRAESEDEVADLLVTIIGDTLGYSGTTIRFVEDGRLAASRVPDAVRDAMPDRPAYPLGGDTPAAEVYRSGETQVFDDLSAARPELGRGDIRATAYVPIAEHGLISVGSFEIGGIAPFDLRLIEVLGGYATLVLDRLGRVESLREAKEAAEEADRIKTALLSNMNHELRTPLTSILTFAELIDQNPSAAGQFTGRVLGGARRLLYTLNTVMEFAELEGEVRVDRSFEMNDRCQLDGTVRSVAGDYREQAQQKGIDLEVEVSKEGPVRLDSHLLERVLTHLLDNSVKFTENGQISVRATVSEEELELKVDDTGVGIAPDFLPRAFDEFAQASTGLSRRYEGNGLGLTVAKRLVDRVGGDIEVESDVEQGTCVTVRLPTGG